jgi:hypothetical protein
MSSPSFDHSDASRPLFRRHQLILHRGKGVDSMRTLRTIMELTRFGVAEASQKMSVADHLGRAQLLVTHQERAELYAQQFADRGVIVSVEPVE